MTLVTSAEFAWTAELVLLSVAELAIIAETALLNTTLFAERFWDNAETCWLKTERAWEVTVALVAPPPVVILTITTPALNFALTPAPLKFIVVGLLTILLPSSCIVIIGFLVLSALVIWALLAVTADLVLLKTTLLAERFWESADICWLKTLIAWEWIEMIFFALVTSALLAITADLVLLSTTLFADKFCERALTCCDKTEIPCEVYYRNDGEKHKLNHVLKWVLLGHFSNRVYGLVISVVH